MTATLVVEVENSTDTDRVKDTIETETVSGVTVTEHAADTGWTQGEPCPDCGGVRISVLSPTETIYHSAGGEFEFLKSGDYIGDAISFMCMECEEVLQERLMF